MRILKKWMLLLLMGVVFVITLVAASANSEAVALRFLDFESPSWPVSWWLLAAFVLGVLFGNLLNLFSNTRLRIRHRAAEKRIDAANRALDQERARAPDEKSPVEGSLPSTEKAAG